jgi:hypothetical protein
MDTATDAPAKRETAKAAGKDEAARHEKHPQKRKLAAARTGDPTSAAAALATQRAAQPRAHSPRAAKGATEPPGKLPHGITFAAAGSAPNGL